MDHIDYLANLVGVDHVGVGLDIGNGRSPYGKYVTPDSEKGKPAAMFTPRLFPEVSIWTEGDDITKTNVQELAPPVPRVLNVARGAIARGYSDQEIVKILGENFLRVFDAVWKK